MTKKTNPIIPSRLVPSRLQENHQGCDRKSQEDLLDCELPLDFLVIGQMVVQGSVKCLPNTQNYKWTKILLHFYFPGKIQSSIFHIFPPSYTASCPVRTIICKSSSNNSFNVGTLDNFENKGNEGWIELINWINLVTRSGPVSDTWSNVIRAG